MKSDPALERVLRRHFRQRMRLEREAIARVRVVDLRESVRTSILRAADGEKWSVRAHARAMPALREAGRAFGRSVTSSVSMTALEAAARGLADAHEWLSTAAKSATGRASVIPVREGEAASSRALVTVRTADIGALAGEQVGSVAAARSLALVEESSIVVAREVGLLAETRASSELARIAATEITAAYSAASRSTKNEFGLKRVWDASLDRKVCKLCASLHHRMEPWPVEDAPAHPRCRCATMPWHEDFNMFLDSIGVAPGPRPGVSGDVETDLSGGAHLDSFGTLAPLGFGR